VQVGEWGITDAQAGALREYLLRGGFFMADDFHGAEEWEVFRESMHRVFPGPANRGDRKFRCDFPHRLRHRYALSNAGGGTPALGYKNNGTVPTGAPFGTTKAA